MCVVTAQRPDFARKIHLERFLAKHHQSARGQFVAAIECASHQPHVQAGQWGQNFEEERSVARQAGLGDVCGRSSREGT